MSRDDNLVVVTALGLEASGLLRRAGAGRLRRSGALRSAVGTLAGRRVRMVVTGDGERRARRGIERLLTTGSPEIVFLAGAAGALSPDLKLGDLLAARAVVGAGATLLPPPSVWLSALLEHPRTFSGRIATAGRVIGDPAEKERLLVEMGPGEPAVVDLETAVWATALDRARVPWVALRGVSDAASEELAVDFNRFRDAGGSVRSWRVLAWALPRPSRWRQLADLRRRVLRVSEGLATLLSEVLGGSGKRSRPGA